MAFISPITSTAPFSQGYILDTSHLLAPPTSDQSSRHILPLGPSDKATIDAAIEAVLNTTTTPLHARDIEGRLRALGVLIGGSDPSKSVNKRLSTKPYVTRLADHGYWHRGRDYPPAGWQADMTVAPAAVEVPQLPSPLSAETTEARSDESLQGLLMEVQDLDQRRRSELLRERRAIDRAAAANASADPKILARRKALENDYLRSAWISGVMDVTKLLEASIRFFMQYTQKPVGQMTTIKTHLREMGVPPRVCRDLSLRQMKEYRWMDNIRGHGLWLRGRPVPDGLPHADQAIRMAARAALQREGRTVRAEELLDILKADGMRLSDVDNANEINILRIHLREVDGVQSRTTIGYWLPEATHRAA